MSTPRSNRRLGLGAAAFTALGLLAVTLPLTPAQAQWQPPMQPPMQPQMPPPTQPQPYLGIDFGRGIGIGIGPVPSATNPHPDYGWSLFGIRPY